MANDFDTTNPARRLEDHRPAAQLDWGKPDAPAVPKSTTAGAARQGGNTGLEGLARYTEVAEYTGDELVIPDPRGEYVKFKDVERLFASIPPLTAPVPHYRKATTELSLPELAEQFEAVAKLGGEYTLSAGVCAKLYEAMTTPPAAPAPQQSDLLNEILALAKNGVSHGLVADDFCARIVDKIEWAKAAPAAPVEQHGIQSSANDPMRTHFTCEAKTNTDCGINSTLYFTKIGAHGTFQFYRNEVEALYVNIGKALGIAPAAPVQTAETDLSKRLRAIAAAVKPNDPALVTPKCLTDAADEIDRYYNGMRAWKQTAEKKDRDWNAERMGRIDDRIAAKSAAPVHAALEQAQADALDAGRYRWLRDDANNAHFRAPMVFVCNPGDEITWVDSRYGADLDAAVDIAKERQWGSRTPSTPEASEQQGGQQ
jgi:hypothetical protein